MTDRIKNIDQVRRMLHSWYEATLSQEEEQMLISWFASQREEDLPSDLLPERKIFAAMSAPVLPLPELEHDFDKRMQVISRASRLRRRNLRGFAAAAVAGLLCIVAASLWQPASQPLAGRLAVAGSVAEEVSKLAGASGERAVTPVQPLPAQASEPAAKEHIAFAKKPAASRKIVAQEPEDTAKILSEDGYVILPPEEAEQLLIASLSRTDRLIGKAVSRGGAMADQAIAEAKMIACATTVETEVSVNCAFSIIDSNNDNDE